ncbi:MAG: ADP-ribosylation factor-like protein [Candidatus Thorarchaeota archaeon]
MGKILLLGLPKSGKTSILRESYQTITSTDEENPHKKKILKVKSLEKLLQIEFYEENTFEAFSKEKIRGIFSNVQVVLWVVDIADHRTISTSLFHWKKMLEYIKDYSNFASRFVCFHKTDLLTIEDKNTLFNTLKSSFQGGDGEPVKFYYTSLKDDSVLEMMAQIMKVIHESSFEIKQAHNKINEFLQTNEDFYGVTILSSDGLPIIEVGEKVDIVILPANLWLGTNERLKEAFGTNTLTCTIHLDEQILLFFDIGTDLLMTTVAKKEAPLQFSFIRSDMLSQSLREILDAS